MAITVVALPAEFVQRVLAGISPGKPALASSAEKEAWRKGNLQRIAADMATYAGQHGAVKTGLWQDNEKLLSGQSQELPRTVRST
jgi:hypothetical protein